MAGFLFLLKMIKFDSVCKTYKTSGFIPRKAVALKNLSLEIKKGETFGYIGPNGAGKTTTIKILLSLIFPTSGRVSIEGRDWRRTSNRKKIGFLPDQPFFYDYLTCYEFFDYCAKLSQMEKKYRPDRINEIICLVGLEGKEDIQLRKFSRGMLQRAGLGQALLHDPEIYVFDEPLTGLDPIGRKEFRDIILNLKKRGKTIFFSSHILGDAEQVCDRVGILDRGELKAAGKMGEIISGKIKNYEIIFRSENNISKHLVNFNYELKFFEGKYFLEVGGNEKVNEILENIIKNNGRIEGVIPQKETLEDIFLKTVNKK